MHWLNYLCQGFGKDLMSLNGNRNTRSKVLFYKSL